MKNNSDTLQGYDLIIRLKIKNIPGMLGNLLARISESGAYIGGVDLVRITQKNVIRDISLRVINAEGILRVIRSTPGVKVMRVSDSVLLAHLGGKLEIRSKVSLQTRKDLATFYTPGVARACMAIHDDPSSAYTLTTKGNTIAIVTDGTAVLGLGDIGPAAALPVMEGKSIIFKEFGGVDAYPVCLDTKDPDEIVRIVKALAPALGGINLEDISAPRCFEIEDRLRGELDIPVFHDDQHGTAVVVYAAMINALKIVGKEIGELKIVFSGIGAGGNAVTKMLMAAGARNIIGCDRAGAIYRGRTDHMDEAKQWYAEHTNPDRCQGSLKEVLRGADVFIGLSAPGLLNADDIRTMARDPIVFALANPTPEIMPEEASKYARIVATGRSDFPNQINNSLCFPGLFRGVLDVRAREINDEMKVAAARAIASIVRKSELSEEYIIPSMFNRAVARKVAAAVRQAAYKTGVARKKVRTHGD